jgi:hypothetical protein
MGANININNGYLLGMAFEFDRDEIIEFLLEKGICYN